MRMITLTFLFMTFTLTAQDSLKSVSAYRVAQSPRIDGVLDEPEWQNAEVAKDFIQDEPEYNKPSSQRTEVRIMYDNNAIYVGAFMYDVSPDSILHELGSRDDGDLNSDYFLVGFDTYGTLIDCYVFGVSASGVQSDFRENDMTFDAVWFSAVKINDKGWVAELKIPYSAIRFPETKTQSWRCEFERKIRRRRENSRWTFIPKDQENFIKFFGKLEGISDIKAPLRLSLTPYLSGYAESSPEFDDAGNFSYARSFSYNLGADLKYGLDDRFTLDVTLFPDFGQVQSDNKVKNLSYREIIYAENRPFFKEGTELFDKDGLFYSRRIGKTPNQFYNVPYYLNPGEVILENPSQVKLLNATKISGRNNNGLGIGFINAVTDNMYAVLMDSTGAKREVLTEPVTNSNIFVFDQQLKNSSSVYFINTNVIRGNEWDDANVSGLGGEFYNKRNTIRFEASSALSQLFSKFTTGQPLFTDLMGFKYFTELEKVGGNFRYGINHQAYSPTYNQMDLGYFIVNNFRSYGAFVTYNQFEPGKIFRFSEVSLDAEYAQNFESSERTLMEYNLESFGMLKNYLAVFTGAGLSPYKNYDYYEPRVDGRYYITRRYYYIYAGFSTDYRKAFAADLKGTFAHYINEGIGAPFMEGSLGLRFRFSDRFSAFYDFRYSFDEYNEGFVDIEDDMDIIFGGRQLETFENRMRVKYIFNPDMSLSLNARHYWNTGKYLQFYTLLDEGTLAINNYHEDLHDFSYNAFNIDLVYSWIFSPGSQLSIVYKNAIETDELVEVLPRFGENFGNTFSSPQMNSVSVKFLYYLDFLKLRKKS